jgi:hypothetical protein
MAERGDLISVEKAAEVLGFRSTNTVRRLVIDGVLDGWMLYGRLWITVESIDRAGEDMRLVWKRLEHDRISNALGLLD